MYFFFLGGGDTPFHLTTNIYVFIVKKLYVTFYITDKPHALCLYKP